LPAHRKSGKFPSSFVGRKRGKGGDGIKDREAAVLNGSGQLGSGGFYAKKNNTESDQQRAAPCRTHLPHDRKVVANRHMLLVGGRKKLGNPGCDGRV